ncbi:MAG: hypothetical protein ACTHJW_21350 [Streptosporangiaceae bacterium]
MRESDLVGTSFRRGRDLGIMSGVMAEDQRVRRVRPYYWGAIYINDADCDTGFDIDFHNGEGPVLATASHVAVLVLHAGTVEEGAADVTLDVRVTSERVNGFPYEVVLEVPSGRLYIGDADDSDEVALQAGRWLLQFKVDEAVEAQHVDLMISPI